MFRRVSPVVYSKIVRVVIGGRTRCGRKVGERGRDDARSALEGQYVSNRFGSYAYEC